MTMCARGVGLGLGGVEAGPNVVLQLQTGPARKRSRRHVEFDVECAQFGLIGGIGDRGEHVEVGHGGLVVVVDQIALDLHARHGTVAFETRSREHRLEHVEAQLHFCGGTPDGVPGCIRCA